MTGPADSLWRDVELLDEALEPFSAPAVDERSGLRWMRRTLTERRAQIVAKIAEAEQSTVTVRVRSAAGSGAVTATVVARLLEAVQRAVRDAAEDIAWPDDLTARQRSDAVRLEVEAAGSDDEQWWITLHRPAGPLSAQPVVTDSACLAIDAALVAMVERFLDGDTGGLGDLALAEGLTLEVTVTPATTGSRTVAVDRQTVPAARDMSDADKPFDGTAGST